MSDQRLNEQSTPETAGRGNPDSDLPSMTRGGGERALRIVGFVIYAAAWSWLIFGMLAGGAWISASFIVAILVGLVALPQIEMTPHSDMRPAVAAIIAGALWVAAPLIALLDSSLSDTAWPWQAAALLLMSTILALRGLERSVAPWMGAIGWLIGWLPVFLCAALAGGIGGPLAAAYAPIYIPLGVLLFVVATVPFAVVALWAKVIDRGAASLLVLGAILMSGSAGPGTLGSDIQPIALAGSTMFGAGWALIGLRLLRARGPVVDSPD